MKCVINPLRLVLVQTQLHELTCSFITVTSLEIKDRDMKGSKVVHLGAFLHYWILQFQIIPLSLFSGG